MATPDIWPGDREGYGAVRSALLTTRSFLHRVHHTEEVDGDFIYKWQLLMMYRGVNTCCSARYQ